MMALQSFEHHAIMLIVNIITLIIMIFISKAAYSNMYKKSNYYTYIIEPTHFIKQLAVYGGFCSIFGVLFDLINNIAGLCQQLSDYKINFYRNEATNILYFATRSSFHPDCHRLVIRRFETK